MLNKTECTLYSGGLKGSEQAFGETAEKWGVKEVTLTFADHKLARQVNVKTLSDEELAKGDISMELASKMMNRTYYQKNKIRKVLQTIFHMVNNGHQIFAIGTILENNTVKGGTGWAVELARLFNRPVNVYDQEQGKWFSWLDGSWQQSSPKIEYDTFVGSGTRNLNDNGRKAIEQLFADSFGSA